MESILKGGRHGEKAKFCVDCGIALQKKVVGRRYCPRTGKLLVLVELIYCPDCDKEEQAPRRFVGPKNRWLDNASL